MNSTGGGNYPLKKIQPLPGLPLSTSILGGKVLVELVEKLVNTKQTPVKTMALNGNAFVPRLPEGLECVSDNGKHWEVAFAIGKRNWVNESNP